MIYWISRLRGRRVKVIACAAAVVVGAVTVTVALSTRDDPPAAAATNGFYTADPNSADPYGTAPSGSVPTVPSSPSTSASTTSRSASSGAPVPGQSGGATGGGGSNGGPSGNGGGGNGGGGGGGAPGASTGGGSGTPSTGKIIDIKNFTGYGTLSNPELVRYNGMVVMLFDGRALLAALNIERAKAGLPKVAWSQDRAVWAASCAAKNATTKGNGLDHCGWEVLIGGGVSPTRCISMWLASKPHRNVIMSSRANVAGASQARLVDGDDIDRWGAGALAPAQA